MSKTKVTRKSARTAAKNNPPLPLLIGGAVVLLLALVGVVWLGGQGQAQTASLPSEISAAEAYQMYQEGAFVLDVREPFEWDEYHAPNTTLIPLGELAARLDELPKDREIVIICRSGNRSLQALNLLKQSGFTNATSMSGGLISWRSAGYPIEP